MRALVPLALPVALALAVIAIAPAAAAQTAPFGFHVGLGPDGADLAVQWITRSPEPGGAVEVADAEGRSAGTFEATTEALPEGAQWIHTAVLAGLPPGEYAYRVAGEERALRVPPREGPVRLGFLGDQGVGEAAAASVATLEAARPDAVMHAGDLAYAEGDVTVWDAWFRQNEPVAAGTPWLPALGNHETYFIVPVGAIPVMQAKPNPEVESFKRRFALPGNELWWSWDVGDVHVVAVDTFWMTFVEDGEEGPEARWLAEDLAAADKPWTVVFLHEPPFSSNDRHGSSLDLRAALGPLLESAGVDLVVAGHDHSYERTWPLRGDKPAATAQPYPADAGPVYMVTGGGGATLYRGFEPQPAWSAARFAEHHVVLVDATADALDVRAVGADGRTLDEFRIVRAAAAPGGDAPAPIPGFAALLALAGLAAAGARRR